MSDHSNPALNGIQRFSNKLDDIGDGMKDFMERQASGESPDPEEFSQLLEAQSVTKAILFTQFNLLQKPLKVVLNESRG